ncbi:maturation protein [ssRNA phage Gephyllon.1_1]|uniref:Maturation protein n=2 Tax=Leviviricetes TaxID=2842243 RepID=A0A8S5KY98_9VIRU|nr:maturation protein [ssRNA phage Gephyllon.1_1]QDH86871.1 MAG: hypothetical protein H1BulkLitter4111_000001 [Leviviridae sp.]DAD50021.1 TPA_asm: maturation protein [ssRNA phage Gephyllon.1_1]
MAQQTKRRDLPWKGWKGVLHGTTKDNPDYVIHVESGHAGFMGKQETLSENHPSWLARKRGSIQGDAGGDFLMKKQYVETPESAVFRSAKASYRDTLHTGYNMKMSFTGGSIPSGIPANPWPAYQNSSNAGLDAWGAKAISICKPDSRVANAATTLIELYREGLPHLMGAATWEARALSAKAAGNDYLNVEFGYKPLANDIAKFAYGVIYFDKVVRQMQRDLGRVVRRRYSFPPIVSTDTQLVREPATPAYIPSSTICDTVFPNTAGRTYQTTVTTVNRWFSGAFTNYAPPVPEGYGRVDAATKLLGLDLTPEVLWEVMPWSWAVDWFSDAGSVISNFQAFKIDGLVMRYGYVMEHVVSKRTYYHTGPTGSCFGDSVYPTSMVFVTETKARRRANPYGFGLTDAGLTGRQKTILGALGITKSR